MPIGSRLSIELDLVDGVLALLAEGEDEEDAGEDGEIFGVLLVPGNIRS